MSLSGKRGPMFSSKRSEDGTQKPDIFRGYLPLMGGIRFPVVGSLDVQDIAEGNFQLTDGICYLWGLVQVLNLTAGAISTFELWDGEPDEAGSRRIYVSADDIAGSGALDIIFHAPVMTHKPLWVKFAGAGTASIDLIIHCNH